MIVTLTKDLDAYKQGELFEWLFNNLGSPPCRWSLQSLNTIKFENFDDGVFFKLVWGNRC